MARQTVKKTYKLYINGAFVRSERGRVLKQNDKSGNFVANYSWATRKDFRNAVKHARKAQPAWASRTALNRSLILYRISEMLEDKREGFETSLVQLTGMRRERAARQIDTAIDLIFYYAGWADKYGAMLSSVNQVSAPFFNFTIAEPVGVVAGFSADDKPFVSLVEAILPVICSGNVLVLIVEDKVALMAIDFAEILATSDLPKGVVNILTGKRAEISSFAAGHKDVDSLVLFGSGPSESKKMQELGSEHVKRIQVVENNQKMGLDAISKFVEFKTTWHPIGI